MIWKIAQGVLLVAPKRRTLRGVCVKQNLSLVPRSSGDPDDILVAPAMAAAPQRPIQAHVVDWSGLGR
jgi:hypothetical protein